MLIYLLFDKQKERIGLQHLSLDLLVTGVCNNGKFKFAFYCLELKIKFSQFLLFVELLFLKC